MYKIIFSIFAIIIFDMGSSYSIFSANPLYAQAKLKKKAANASKRGVRERSITREKRYKGKAGDRTKVNFDELDISGAAKMSLGSMVDQTKARKEYGLFNPRMRWHTEMVESSSSLETGGARR